ncbi:MAG: hypothetical protein QM522_04050 [Chitinophagaceae bacterium]|nr:hypothetical protein [Chitinophagaceae bacterium]
MSHVQDAWRLQRCSKAIHGCDRWSWRCQPPEANRFSSAVVVLLFIGGLS